MIDYVIFEDERFAYEEIKRMMNVLRPDYNLKEWADSVERAVSVLTDGTPDLLIADIRLSDGLCFDVFERKQTHVPVIFTTAYDEFALQAFRVNSVDYLLKPIKENDLERALAKFEANCLTRPTSEQYLGTIQGSGSFLPEKCQEKPFPRFGGRHVYVCGNIRHRFLLCRRPVCIPAYVFGQAVHRGLFAGTTGSDARPP